MHAFFVGTKAEIDIVTDMFGVICCTVEVLVDEDTGLPISKCVAVTVDSEGRVIVTNPPPSAAAREFIRKLGVT